MANFTDLAGLAGVAGVSAAAVLLLPGIAGITKPRLAALQGTVFVLMLIPLGALPLAGYVRGVTGDFSITTLVLVCCALLRPWFACTIEDFKTRRVSLVWIALTGLVFYPLALGMTAFDPYRLGYGDPQFVAELLLAASAAWIWKQHLIASCIAFATLAWTVGWYESDNLWDYLLDPWVAMYALMALAYQGTKSFKARGGTHEI